MKNIIDQIFLPLIACVGVLLLNGCGSVGAPPDESNLRQVAYYYYQPGKSNQLANNIRYDFLSASSKSQTSFEEWDKSHDASVANHVVSVRLWHSSSYAGQQYEVVSVTDDTPDKDGIKHRKIYSHTWILEGGKWRRLEFKNAREDYEKAFQAGDFEAAVSKANAWIQLDPCSIEAYQSLCGAIVERVKKRLGEPSTTPTEPGLVISDDASQVINVDKSVDQRAEIFRQIHDMSCLELNDSINAMIAINPLDSATVDYATNYLQFPINKMQYFSKLKALVTDPEDVFDIGEKIQEMGLRIGFLQGFKETPKIHLLMLEAVAISDKSNDNLVISPYLKEYLSNAGDFKSIKSGLNALGPADRVRWAVKLARLVLDAKDYAYAQELLDYIQGSDSEDPQVKALAVDLKAVQR